MSTYAIHLELEIPSNRELVVKLPEHVPVGPIEVTLTIVPKERCTEQDRARIRSAIAEMKEFGKGRRLDGLSIREMIEDGREPEGGR